MVGDNFCCLFYILCADIISYSFIICTIATINRPLIIFDKILVVLTIGKNELYCMDYVNKIQIRLHLT